MPLRLASYDAVGAGVALSNEGVHVLSINLARPAFRSAPLVGVTRFYLVGRSPAKKRPRPALKCRKPKSVFQPN